MKFRWKVHLPLLTTEENVNLRKFSNGFCSSKTPVESKWKLGLYYRKADIAIRVLHFNSITSASTVIPEPTLVKISIMNNNGHPVLQEIKQSKPKWTTVKFIMSKQDIIDYKCQEPDGSLNFSCELFSHVIKEPFSAADPPPGLAMNCSSELMDDFEGLLDGMPYSDVIFNVHGREFKAHKFILAARSEVFTAIFQHPTTEENFTTRINIEDIPPDKEIDSDVFQHLLRFIYTGRISITTLETFSIGLLVAGDKYELGDLERNILKVYSLVQIQSIPTVDTPDIPFESNGLLINQLQKLFDGMEYSDLVINVHGREFPAHKAILVTRSEVFAAMFRHSTKENLTNRIEIEDMEPEVFQELLRFIYTGRLSITTMEKLTVGLLMAADKYMLKELVRECTVYLIDHMSPVHCVELFLHVDLLNPPEHLENVLKKATVIFNRSPDAVFATAKWVQMEKTNAHLMVKILKFFVTKIILDRLD
jgi:speckle-type POZ protein